MTPNDPDWTPTKRQEAYLRIACAFPFPTHNDAARTAGIPQDTVRRWHKDKAFVAEYDRRCADALPVAEQIELSIADVAAEALNVKLAILRDKKASAYVRDQVATWLLERVVGKTPDRIQHEGKDGDSIKAEVTHKHDFDFDAFRALWRDTLSGGSGGSSPADGSQ